MPNPNSAPFGGSIYETVNNEKYKEAEKDINRRYNVEDEAGYDDDEVVSSFSINNDFETDGAAGERTRGEKRATGERTLNREMINQRWEEFKHSTLAKVVLTGALVTLAVGAPILTILNYRNKQKPKEEPAPYTSEAPEIEQPEITLDTEVEDTSAEEEKQVNVYTGIEKFDETVDGSFKQYDDIGMNGSKTKEEGDQYGKVSKNAMVATDALLHEYMDTDLENATVEQKAKAMEMSCYKQASSAAAFLISVQAEGFKGMDYLRAVEKIENASEEERNAILGMLKGYFDNAEVAEETVNEVRQTLATTGQNSEYADYHLYRNRQTGEAEYKNIKTGNEEKVLTFKYKESTTVTRTTRFLEKCGNIFQMVEIYDEETEETTYEITVYKYEENDKKDPEAEKKNMGNDYTDVQELDEETTPQTTEDQNTEPIKNLEEQKAQDDNKAAEDQTEKERQAAEEEAARKAAEEAERAKLEEEQRKAAEEAAAKAAAEKEEAQRKAAEEAAARQAEEEALRKAQEEADGKAEEEKAHAEEMSINDEARDAEDWANGDFALPGDQGGDGLSNLNLNNNS